jgi:hypothetical protein
MSPKAPQRTASGRFKREVPALLAEPIPSVNDNLGATHSPNGGNTGAPV